MLAAVFALLAPAVWASSPALRALPLSHRQELEDVGYSFDAMGQALGPDGQALTEAALEDWLKPYDFRREPLSDAERSDLVLDGCRLEKASSHVLCLPDKKPLSRLAVYGRKGGSRQAQRNALERLGVLLRGADPKAPVGADVLDAARALEKAQPGSVPPAVRSALLAPKASAGQALTALDAAYLESTRFFDGRVPLSEQLKTAVPLPAGWHGDAHDPKFFDDGEKQVSAELQRAFVQRVRANPVAAELLGRFLKPDGSLDLPPMHVLPISAAQAGTYQAGEIAVSRDDLLSSLAGGDERMKRRLDARLSTSAALAAYLARNPRSLDRYLAANDGTLVHELTHAWQSRRDRLWGETDRGNVPGGDLAEDEHEAFLTELRFVHEELKKNPYQKLDDETLERYGRLAADFDRWRDGITEDYFRDFPDATYTLQTTRQVQDERASVARRLMGETVYQAVYQAAKLAGIAVGNVELDSFSAAYSKQMNDFVKNDYPSFRKEAFGVLARRKLAEARNLRPGQERDIQLGEAAEMAAQSGDAELSAEIEAARKKPEPLHAS